MGVFFSLNIDLCSAWVTTPLYAISCDIELYGGAEGYGKLFSVVLNRSSSSPKQNLTHSIGSR